MFGLIDGLLFGLLPLFTGMKKNQPGLAFGGFFGCIVAGNCWRFYFRDTGRCFVLVADQEGRK